MEATKEMYSEVYSILNLLGDNFINKLPKQLYSLIQNEKSDTYNPTYTSISNLRNQSVKKESISMIALLHLNYWCNGDEEKQKLRDLFIKNEKKYQAELKEKYDVDNLFKKNAERRNATNNASSEQNENNNVVTPFEATNSAASSDSYETVDIFSNDKSLVEYKKESFIRKLINKFKSLFKRKG